MLVLAIPDRAPRRRDGSLQGGGMSATAGLILVAVVVLVWQRR